jgi:hypothetical protein
MLNYTEAAPIPADSGVGPFARRAWSSLHEQLQARLTCRQFEETNLPACDAHH